MPATPVFIGELSGIGCFLAGLAAWFSIWSPRAKRRKQARREKDQRDREIYEAICVLKAKEQRDREIHEALYGLPERRDDSGALIAKSKAGLIATVLAMSERLDAPLLNGTGEEMAQTVRRLDKRTVGLLRRVGAIEKHIRIGADSD